MIGIDGKKIDDNPLVEGCIKYDLVTNKSRCTCSRVEGDWRYWRERCVTWGAHVYLDLYFGCVGCVGGEAVVVR